MKYRVVLVPFPFDDLSSSKVRPALSLSDEIGAHRHLIIAFITSRIPANILDTDLVLNANDPDFATTGLKGLHQRSAAPANDRIISDHSV